MSVTRSPRAVWRREPRECGLAGISQGTRGWELRRGGEVLIHIAVNGNKYADGPWYWYGMDHNTLWRSSGGVFQTVEETKADAMAYVKAKREGK